MRQPLKYTAAALLLLSLSPQPAQAGWFSNLIPQSVYTYFGYGANATPDPKAFTVTRQIPLGDGPSGSTPYIKEIISLKDCDRLPCEIIDGKLVIKKPAPGTYDVTDPNSVFKEELVQEVTKEDIDKDPLLVDTEAGPLLGFYNHGLYRGVNYRKAGIHANTPRGWLGVPFAQPPVGNLRFRPPRPYTRKWGPKARTAYQTPKACPQSGFETHSDDCLYLNVFAPSTERMKELGNKPLPVMFYIFGGAFNVGSGYMYGIYDGRHITTHQDIIVVTINHRVGLMGFLVADTENEPITGNMGIKDQLMALQWVNRNIANFGGDPNNVSMVGLSSGAQSVMIHLISDATPANLFHKAVMFSAPFAHYSRTMEEQKEMSKGFLERLGCMQHSKKLQKKVVSLSCLRDVDYKLMAKEGDKEPDQWDPLSKESHPLTTHYYWWPSIDGEVLKKQPVDSILAGEFKRMPILFGVTRDEMGFFSKMNSIPHGYWLAKALGLRNFFSKANLEAQRKRLFKSETIDKMLAEYYPFTDDDHKNEVTAIALSSDAVFKCPATQMSDLLAKENNEVYLYEIIKPADYLSVGRCSTDMVCHGFDIPYLWRPYFVWFSKEEIKMLDQYTNYIVDFMYGDVNRRAKVPWPKYTVEKKQYMNIAPNPAVGHQLRQAHCNEVWGKIGYNF
jgi:acetylcholinesterase/cholinesterase